MTTHSPKLIPLVCIPAWRCLASTLAAALGADELLLRLPMEVMGRIRVSVAKYLHFLWHILQCS